MKSHTVSLTALLLSFCSCSAFLVGRPMRSVVGFRLAQTPEQPAEDQPTSAPEAAASEDISQEESIDVPSEEEPAEEKEQEKEEDPEMVALKAEITELEATLKVSRSRLASTSDKADDFSKAGYARKVAEMESLRKISQMRQKSNKSASVAAVLTEFVPMRERLEELQSQYSEDDFGKQYNALPSAMKAAFDELGATDYTLAVGETIDESRCVVIDREYSQDIPKDAVIRPVRIGIELQGNVVRAAECIASLGPENSEEESSEEEEAGSEVENPEIAEDAA